MMKSAIAALIASSVSACANEWIWEECSQSWYRDPCIGEFTDTYCDCAGGYDKDTCGWIYYDDWNLEEFQVTCSEFDDWWWCEY